jgi:hypothetical protein
MPSKLDIDLEYRPATYWPAAENREQRLSRISGKARRDITRSALETGGIGELNTIGPEVSAETLGERERQAWGAIHPAFMGGEYLAPLAQDEVEIARISLRSTTSDQVSVRACGHDGDIRYRVVDEYETGYELTISTSAEPLTLAQLVTLMDSAGHPDDIYGPGLIRNHWEYNLEFSDPQVAVDFVSIESAFYPALTSYYSEEASRWIERCEEPGEGFDGGEAEDGQRRSVPHNGRPSGVE